MIAGSDKPPIVKRELLEVAAVTVTFAPLALRVPEPVPLAPTATLPTAMGAGVALSEPAVADPVPAREMVKVGLDPFDVTVTLPLALAVDVGAKVTVKLALCPAVSVTGGLIPLSLKPAPLIPTCETVTVALPILLTVCDSGKLVPVCTVPKFRLVGLAPNVPVPGGGCTLEDLELNPWQATIVARPTRTMASAAALLHFATPFL